MTRLLLLLALLPSQAPALSCDRPDVARSVAAAMAAPEPHVVLSGWLTFDEALMPPPNALPAPEPAPVPALFQGEALLADGFRAIAPREVVVQPLCAGQWCGSIPSGRTWLLIAEAAGDGSLTVESGPCGGRAFPDPTAADLAVAAACVAGGPCAPAP